MIQVDPIAPADAERDYPELWLTVRATFPQLTASECAKVVALVVGVCPFCFKQAAPCDCQMRLRAKIEKEG